MDKGKNIRIPKSLWFQIIRFVLSQPAEDIPPELLNGLKDKTDKMARREEYRKMVFSRKTVKR